MKKIFVLLIIMIFSINYMFVGCTSLSLADGNLSVSCTSLSYNGEEKIYNYEDVKDKIIRFHVLANSDTDDDQNLKLNVKDAVINYLYSYLKDCSTIDESRQVIEEQEDNVREIALQVIKDNGYDYPVTIELSHENFPEKSYGNITLPQGNYEAFRILIGKAEGHNWWCVMFPSLCFIDVTKGQVEEEESQEALDKVVEGDNSQEEVQCKSKFLEFIKNIIK